MKTPYKLMSITALVLMLCSPAFAGWKEKIIQNQIKAQHYIEQLKAGANLEELERPYLRYDKKAKASAANKEIRIAIQKAEDLARKGDTDKILIPEFRFKLVSDEYRQNIQKRSEDTMY